MAVYKSKIDTWLLIALVVGAAAALLAIGMVLYVGQLAIIVGMLIVVLAVGLPIWALASTRYELTDTTLLVRSGPFRWRIAIAEIRDVTPTRNPLSSPALSLDRLRVDYGTGNAIMISPADKAGFLRDLAARRAAVR